MSTIYNFRKSRYQFPIIDGVCKPNVRVRELNYTYEPKRGDELLNKKQLKEAVATQIHHRYHELIQMANQK